jgi:cyclophilin family peptidyl-prolyl cis-trans isomerase/HEAT repeat protein
MQIANLQKTLGAGLLVVASMTTAAGQRTSRAATFGPGSSQIILRIIRAEDERRWNDDLASLLKDQDARLRKRAALALGRIGDERALPALSESLQTDKDGDVRQMSAFAIGEIESPAGVDALVAVLDDTRQPGAVRARAVEALGKIGAVLLNNTSASAGPAAPPKPEDKALTKIRLAVLDALKFEAGRRSMPDRQTILLGLTAALRVRPNDAGPIVVKFLGYSDPRIVADALNTMARLRLKDANDHVRQLLNNGDPVVRANAARVIGAAEDKGAFDVLLARALNDTDLRVRVSAIRSLGSLKDARAAEPLFERGSQLLAPLRAELTRNTGNPSTQNELLEIVTALGRVSPQIGVTPPLREDRYTRAFFSDLQALIYPSPPEVELAFARIMPGDYVSEAVKSSVRSTKQATPWKQVSSVAQGLAEVAALKIALGDSSQIKHSAEVVLGNMLCAQREDVAHGCSRTPTLALPDVTRAYAAFKPSDLSAKIKWQLKSSDVIVRATAAEMLGELPPEAISTRLLIEALPRALQDKDLNDAALAILDALAKQKSAAANDAIKTALDSSDHLIRRRAVALLKANDVGDFSNRIGTVKTRYTDADYRRAIARSGKNVTATVVTSKGAFTIEFMPEEAPLTIDNFIQLARKGYFNGQTIPRVVPNFVVQAGDPRGDQNGGPGYQIRCEVNEVPYERGAVGMALSGKDTGGSQWFVTHSPQPHLDGGYTVFGRVIRGMEVVDNIARGDIIRRVIISER